MSYLTDYYPDPEEERRFRLAAMDSFANRTPIGEAMGQFGPPPEPDVERANAVLNAPGPAGPSPRELEDDAIRAVRDSYGQKRGLLDDAAPAAIGLLADAFLNKGRGAGAIIGGYGQGVMRRDAEDRSAMRELANLEITRSREAANDQYRKQRNDVEVGNLEQRRAENQLARERFQREYGENGITKYQQMVFDEQKRVHDAADVDRDDARRQSAEQFKQTLADRQAARADAAADRQIHRDQLDFQKGVQADIQREKMENQQREQFVDNTKSQRGQVGRAMQVDEILSRTPQDEKGNYKDIPGIGMWDSIKGDIPLVGKMLQSKDDIAMRGSLTDMADFILRERSGAAAPDPEVQRLAKNVAAGGGVTEKEFVVLQSAYNNILRASMQQNAAGREGVARQVMGSEASNWLQLPPAPPPRLDDPSQRQPIRMGYGAPGAPRSLNAPLSNDFTNVPDDQLPRENIGTTGQRPGQVPKVNEYLRRLQQEDDDLGVGYR